MDTKTVTKCEYYKSNGRWLYRCWYDGKNDAEPATWTVETYPALHAPAVNACVSVVRSITRDRGLHLGCFPTNEANHG